MLGLTKTRVIQYITFPQILPRMKELFGSGFSFLAYLMAQIYSAAGILPKNHPYLMGQNIGRFGIRHVITEAGSRLQFNLKHIDQVIVFAFLLFAVVILLAQLAFLLMSIFTITAYAGIDPGTDLTTFQDFFGRDGIPPDNDIAFMILDQVFGLVDFFNSCVSTGDGNGCFFAENDSTHYGEPHTLIITEYPYPFHLALQDSFSIYSQGLLVIGVLIFVYFLFAVVAETAQTGTPFGQRFNHVWAPIRMVVAFGLLVPIAQGFNSGQWIVFYAAKWGSDFASNGWQVFLTNAMEGASDTVVGEGAAMVAIPKNPGIGDLLEFGGVLAACIKAHEFVHQADDDSRQRTIRAYLHNPDNLATTTIELDGTSFVEAVTHFMIDNVPQDIHISFATPARSLHIQSDTEGENPDALLPECGRLVIPITDFDEDVSPGSYAMQEGFYNLIEDLNDDANAPWNCTGDPDTDYIGYGDLGVVGECMNIRYMQGYAEQSASGIEASEAIPPGAQHLALSRTEYEEQIDIFMLDAIDAQANSEWYEDQSAYGWAGAAIWYNRLAELNGSMMTAVNNRPYIAKYPAIMEEVLDEKRQADSDITWPERFKPVMSDNQNTDPRDTSDAAIARVLYLTQALWVNNENTVEYTGNAVLDVINFIFGTQGLFNIQDNLEAGIYPMAALTAIGKSLVESSIKMMGVAGIASFSAGFLGDAAQVAGSAALTIAMIGLGVGFVLFYVLPFLPFIYFFFAVGGWIKGIFEAMVGVPLWALAHIRIDGNGLPGDAALQGYYLILEVFLRPIMIIFGFVAGVIIFSAQVQVLLEIWNIVTSNVLGFDETCGGAPCEDEGVSGAIQYLRSGVDSFFFTVLFAIIVYMIGMASFKLVDAIPNHILRWMGANASTFGDMNEDQAQGLVQNATIGGQMVGSSLQTSLGGVQSLSQGIGNRIKGGNQQG